MNCFFFLLTFGEASEFEESILCLSLQIKHMMAFIEQEAKEKVEEIDAKVIEACLSVSLVISAAVTGNRPCHTHLFTGRGRVQH